MLEYICSNPWKQIYGGDLSRSGSPKSPADVLRWLFAVKKDARNDFLQDFLEPSMSANNYTEQLEATADLCLHAVLIAGLSGMSLLQR